MHHSLYTTLLYKYHFLASLSLLFMEKCSYLTHRTIQRQGAKSRMNERASTWPTASVTYQQNCNPSLALHLLPPCVSPRDRLLGDFMTCRIQGFHSNTWRMQKSDFPKKSFNFHMLCFFCLLGTMLCHSLPRQTWAAGQHNGFTQGKGTIASCQLTPPRLTWKRV